MATTTRQAGATNRDGPSLVDPRAPRFGQSLTTLGLLAGIILGVPELIYAVAVILGTAVLTRWRYDLWGFIWRRVARRALDGPDEPEPAAPHRFAKLLGAVGTSLATVFLLAGVPLAGYALAGLVAVLAGIAAVTGICTGCHLYRQVSFFHRLDIV